MKTAARLALAVFLAGCADGSVVTTDAGRGLADALLPGHADAASPADASRCDAAGYSPAPEATPLATLDFGDEGATPPVAVPAGAHLLTVALSDPALCAQVDALTTDDGAELITHGDFGLVCQRCLQRESVIAGRGAFALPSDATRLPRSRVSLTLRHCAAGSSLRPLPTGARTTLSLVPLVERPLPRRGVVDLAVIASPSSWLARADDDALRDLARAVSAELTDAALSVRVTSRCVLPDAPDTLDLRVGERAPLAALRRLADGACPGASRAGAVTLWSARCASLYDPVLQQRSSPEGFTTHIPGTVEDDGVVLSDGCFGVPLDGPPPHLARVTAHELGHFFGLYHSVEGDGREDLLPDTDASNLMHAVPTLATSRGLSAQQVTVVRRHPAVRWPVEGTCGE